MKRTYQFSAVFDRAGDLHYRTAYHEAGHAAAIHLRNREQQLPPVFFEIHIIPPQPDDGELVAKVVDGYLIQNLHIAMLESFAALDGRNQPSCQLAYEADIINLLAGPLAEAKYLAFRDGRRFRMPLSALPRLLECGGMSDMERIQAYLEHFIACGSARETKLQCLLEQAFRFVDEEAHWRGISRLAEYILRGGPRKIACEEAIDVLEGGS